jgi:hypothetical protein
MDDLKKERKEDRFKFIVTGAFKDGGASFGEQVLRFADEKLKPDFALFTGDLVRYGGDPVAKFEALEKHSGWFFRKYPSWLAQGDQERPEEYRKFHGFPDDGTMDSYAFEFRNARFIQLSYFQGNWDKQRPWIEAEMRKAQAGNQHLFVFTQKSFYHPGGGKYYLEERGKPSKEHLHVVALFEMYKVTCVFDGDNSLYYRTKRNGVNYLKNQGNAAEGTNASNLAPADVYYCKGDGKRFLLHNPARQPVDDKDIGGHPHVTLIEVNGATVKGNTLSANTGEALDRFLLAGEDK